MSRHKRPRHILPKATPPRYAAEVVALARSLQSERGPGVYHISVYHDDWCDLLNHRGPCNCNFEVREGRPQ